MAEQETAIQNTQEKAFKPLSDEAYNKLLKETKVDAVVEKSADVELLSKKEKEVKVEAKMPEDEAKPNEANPVDEKPKKKFRERIKGDFLNSSKPAEPKAEEVSVTELQKKLSDYEKEINDSDYQTYKAIKAKGKKSIDILQEVMGVNPDKMSDEEIYRHDLTKAGITDPEKVEEEMDLFFNQGSERARKKELEQIRSGMRREVENVQSEFFNKLTAPDPNQEKENLQLQKDAQEFASLVDGAVGKEMYGMNFDKEMATRIVNKMINGELIPKKGDGSIDTVKLFKMQVFGEFEDLMLDNIEKSFYADGVHFIADEVEATPASKTITSRPPDTQHKLEKGTEEWAEKTSKNLVPYNG